MLESLGKWSIASGMPIPTNALEKLLEWKLLGETLTRLQINCVLDVGANVGQFVGNLRQIGYRGHIISFEPVPAAFAEMEQRFKQDALWRGFNLGLGDQDTEVNFNIAVESTAMSSFLAPMDSGWKLNSIPVTMKRLDSLFDSLLANLPPDPRIFLKMDTQGYDVRVVQGAESSIQRVLGIQSELSVVPTYREMPSYLESLRYYEQLGFNLLGITPAMTKADGTIGELNCVMARSK